MRVRRVRYASAARRDARLPRHHAGRAPRARRLAGARRALARASARRPRGDGGGRRPGPRALVGARRPRRPARTPRLVLTVHGTDAALLRTLPARARARAAGVRAREGRHRRVARAGRAGCRTPTGRHVPPAHVHPMPVDSRDLSLDHGRRRRRRGRAAHARRSGSTSPSRPSRSSRRCGHDLPLTIVGDGPERAALERQVERLGIAPFVHFAGAVPHDRDRRLPRARRRHALPGAGRGLRAGRGRGAHGRRARSSRAGTAAGCSTSCPSPGAGRLTLPSPEAMSDAILDLLHDPDRRALARLVGESWRARLSPEHVAEICEGWYREALGA